MTLDSRNKNRRKSTVRTLSGVVEACEARALLSAVVAGDEPTEVDAELDPELDCSNLVSASLTDYAICNDGSLPYELTLDENGELVFVDPEDFARFITMAFSTCAAEGQLSDGISEAESAIEDTDSAPVEGWDPSWLYRTFTSAMAGLGEEPTDGSAIIDVAENPLPDGWEDGLGCGVTMEDFVGEGETVDGTTVDGELIDATDGSLDEDNELVKVDFDWSWVLRGAADGNEGDFIPDDSFVMYAFDPLPVEDQNNIGEEFIDVIDGGEVFAEGQDMPDGGDASAIFYAMAFSSAGGPELQRTAGDAGATLSASTPSASTPAITPAAIPPAAITTPAVTTPGFSSLVARPAAVVSNSRAATEIATLIARTEESAASVAEPVRQQLASPLRKASRGLSASGVVRPSAELNGLTPLFEDSDESAASDAKPAESEDLRPEDEAVSINADREVAAARRYAAAAVRRSQDSGAVRVAEAARSGSVVIDQFMTQYAQDSFMS